MTSSAPLTNSVSSSPPGLLDSEPVDEATLGKRERNKRDKRRRILGAATELFQEKGFEATTTAEIATRADIGAGTLYLYVESKEDLLVGAFVEVAGAAWSEAFDRVDPTADLVQQLMTLFTHVTNHHAADQRLSRAFFRELPFVTPTTRTGATTFNHWFATQLEAMLAAASERDLLDAQVPRATLAHNLYALWQLQMRRLLTDSLSRTAMLAGLEDGVRVALWGMLPTED